MEVFLLFTSCVLAVVSARCPDIPAQDPLILSKLTGTWYKQYSLLSPKAEGSCIEMTFTQGVTDRMLNFSSNGKDSSGEKLEQPGTGTVTQSGTDGTLTFTTSLPSGADLSADLSILHTDYDNFFILYSCIHSDAFENNGEVIGVMTRQRTMTTDVRRLIQDNMSALSQNHRIRHKDNRNIPTFESLTEANQENCS